MGVVQFACTDDLVDNLETASRLIRQAAGKGANIVLVQELFEGLYFCQTQDPIHFGRAHALADHPVIAPMQALARELGIVLPVSFFEKKNQAFYNSIAMIDDTGAILGIYRKSHIPDGPGYSEKFYFRPGDTGFKVWPTLFGTIGVGICWDQWFPEAARAMALMGAELILYPTAIGSEPARPDLDTMEHWRMVMRGHAAANMMPVAAANRIGAETIGGKTQFLLRLVLHCRTGTASLRPTHRVTARPFSSRHSTGKTLPAIAPPGAFSAIADRIFMVLWQRQTEETGRDGIQALGHYAFKLAHRALLEMGF